jgi:hypothetical protein
MIASVTSEECGVSEMSLTAHSGRHNSHSPFHKRAASANVIQDFAALLMTAREEAAPDARPTHVLHPRWHRESENRTCRTLQFTLCSCQTAERSAHGERHRVVDPVVLEFAFLERVAQVCHRVAAVGFDDAVLGGEEAHHSEC